MKAGDVLIAKRKFYDLITTGEEYPIASIDSTFVTVTGNHELPVRFWDGAEVDDYFYLKTTIKPLSHD